MQYFKVSIDPNFSAPDELSLRITVILSCIWTIEENHKNTIVLFKLKKPTPFFAHFYSDMLIVYSSHRSVCMKVVKREREKV